MEKVYQKIKAGQGTITKKLNIRDPINSKTESLSFLNVPGMRTDGDVSRLGGFREYVLLRAALHQ